MMVLVYIVESLVLEGNSLRDQLAMETDFEIRVFSSLAEAQSASSLACPDAWLVSYRRSIPEALPFLLSLGSESVGVAMVPSTGDEGRVVAELGPLRVSSLPYQQGDLLPKLNCALERLSMARQLSDAHHQLHERDQALLASNDFVDKTKEELRLQHDVLETATSRLVEAEQLAAVGRVATGIAHEISNQLALVGYAEEIKIRVPEDSELFEFADAIVIAQRRLATMVGQIRSFTKASRMDHSEVELGDGFELASLSAAVDEALSILRYDKDVRTRKIECHYHATPLVLLKREEFDQVVINLVSNAAIATSAGDTICVQLHENKEERCALLSIEDKGQGMSPDILKRLGEPFFTTRSHRGSGLGVGICMSIARAHGGSIRYESEIGQGTTATVVLPLYEGDQS